jgi:ubiquinone/menaquinone biosynthesis C-methylase UbiE/uncharacterized protein YbaR (Trm112 family)
MKRSLMPLLRCPAGCEAPLGLNAGRVANDNILEGWLCCDLCDSAYPVQEGIPRLLPNVLVEPADQTGDEEIARKRSEMQARDEQVYDYDRLWPLIVYGLIEIPAMLLKLAPSERHTMLEAGCGTGRMTRDFAARCGRLIAVDYSWESLRVNARKLERAGVSNVDLIQADICHLPLRSETCDRVVSAGVIEHVPTHESRQAAVGELARVARKDGNLAVSGYQYSIVERLFGQKEGEHAGGIYFVRFRREEFRSLLSCALHVEAISALGYYYVARCKKKP